MNVDWSSTISKMCEIQDSVCASAVLGDRISWVSNRSCLHRLFKWRYHIVGRLNATFFGWRLFPSLLWHFIGHISTHGDCLELWLVFGTRYHCLEQILEVMNERFRKKDWNLVCIDFLTAFSRKSYSLTTIYLNWFVRISCLLFSQVWPRDKPLDTCGPYVSGAAGGRCHCVRGKSVCGGRIRRGQPMEHGWALSTRHEHLAARGTYEHSSERSR